MGEVGVEATVASNSRTLFSVSATWAPAAAALAASFTHFSNLASREMTAMPPPR